MGLSGIVLVFEELVCILKHVPECSVGSFKMGSVACTIRLLKEIFMWLMPITTPGCLILLFLLLLKGMNRDIITMFAKLSFVLFRKNLHSTMWSWCKKCIGYQEQKPPNTNKPAFREKCCCLTLLNSNIYHKNKLLGPRKDGISCSENRYWDHACGIN